MPARRTTSGSVEELVIVDELDEKLQFTFRDEEYSHVFVRFWTQDGFMGSNFIINPGEALQLHEFLGEYLDKRHRKL